MSNNKYEKDDLFKLYSFCIDQLKYYNNLIWQFPTVLVTLNFIALNYFLDKPEVILILSIVNFSLLYALFRHILNSKKIINTTQKVEGKLRENFGEMIPQFKSPKIKTTSILQIIFLSLNVLLFIISLVGLIQNG